MMFYPEKDVEIAKSHRLALSRPQHMAAILCVVLLALLYYYITNLSVTIAVTVDDYLNYRFCWEVQ